MIVTVTSSAGMYWVTKGDRLTLDRGDGPTVWVVTAVHHDMVFLRKRKWHEKLWDGIKALWNFVEEL